MIAELGHLCLILALAIAVVQTVIPMVGAAKGWRGWMAVAEPAATSQFLLTLFAFGALTWAFVDPMGFAAAQQTALGTAAVAPNPLAALGSIQFFAPQTNFPDPSNPFDNGRVDSNDVTWTARLAYDVTDNFNAYFTYATGYKAGAFNLSSDSRPPVDASGLGRVASPEDVRLFELGFKANFDGGYVNIALFDQKIEGFQSNVFNGIGFDLANAGEQGGDAMERDVVDDGGSDGQMDLGGCERGDRVEDRRHRGDR